MISLLKTKLGPPPHRSDLVARPHLIEQLNHSVQSGHKLTLISAPAGYGKSTLVSEWAEKNRPDAAGESAIQPKITWLSLDEGDNDPARFTTYLIASLQVIDPEIGQNAQLMTQTPQPPPPEAVLTSLINDISAAAQPFVLILEDYHAVRSLPVHQQLGFLVENLPPQAHLVLVTREDPPLPLHLLRTRGQMAEIRQDDLRFLLEECAVFFRQVMGLDLAPSDTAALAHRTEGWAAGLLLAGLSMKGSADIHEFVNAFTGSNRYILDYLIEEVVAQQTAEVQDFLLKTSILDRFCAPLCEAVTGVKDSRNLLLTMERANLFVVPLDQTREWYRYHQLFAELLHHRLQVSGKHSLSTLHKKASRWYETNGFMGDAIQHTLAARDWDEAERLIEGAVPDAIRNGQIAVMDSWLNAIPDGHVRESLTLCITKGWMSFMMGQFEAAALYSEQAEDLLPADAPPEIRLPLTALLSSLALIQQDIPTAIQLSQEILDSTDLKDDFVRGMALNNLAQGTMMIGDIPSATAYYREIVRLSQISGQSPTTISASAQLATLLHQGGKRRAAMSVCQQALQQCVDTRGRTLPLAGYVHIPLGMLYFEGNDIDLARQHLLKGMEYGKQLGLVTGVTTYGGVALAQLQQASGEKDAALKTIAKIRQLASQFNLEHVNRMASGIEADIMIKQGNLQAAASWAEAAGLSPSDTPAPFQEGEYLTYGRVLLASSRLDEAEVLLANFERIALEAGLQRSLITIYILQALTQQSMGRGKDALAPLGKALHLAAPEDYRRAFLDEGQAVIDLLPKIRPLEPAFVDQLLEDVQAEPGLVVPSPRVQPLIEPLSERELEILQLVADGLSNQEIAARLVLSVGTIKAHLHNIYGKLEVRGRTQAIARAREIDLI